jgi:hypothetical protein
MTLLLLLHVVLLLLHPISAVAHHCNHVASSPLSGLGWRQHALQ